jgi:hypothetical protein
METNRQAVIVDIGHALSKCDRLGTDEFAYCSGLWTPLSTATVAEPSGQEPNV